MPRPTAAEFAPFYNTYVSKTQHHDVVEELSLSVAGMAAFLNALPAEKADYAYAPGKWTIKQVLQHCIDTERIMAYRALCVARGESQSLPGFDENAYAATAQVGHRSLKQLTDELMHARASSVLLFQSFDAVDLQRLGTANGQPISANALGFIIVGHVLHHQQVLTERYL
jgi:hypothetical protein